MAWAIPVMIRIMFRSFIPMVPFTGTAKPVTMILIIRPTGRVLRTCYVNPNNILPLVLNTGAQCYMQSTNNYAVYTSTQGSRYYSQINVGVYTNGIFVVTNTGSSFTLKGDSSSAQYIGKNGYYVRTRYLWKLHGKPRCRTDLYRGRSRFGGGCQPCGRRAFYCGS